MRLLHLNPRETLRSFNDADDVPPYAILSHTWGPGEEEVTIDDIRYARGRDKTGYAKLKFCLEQAGKDMIEYVWIDTCCIDKTNSTELSEAVVSMFRYYQNAAKCYVFLSDVTCLKRDRNDENGRAWEESFRNSRWFTRGWTLQELIAPRDVVFFSREAMCLGTKSSLENIIHEITTIPFAALRGQPLIQFSIKERMRWTEGRKTLRREDQAYCLLGIFGVFMPLLYGEGDNALRRLYKELEKQGTMPTSIDLERKDRKPIEDNFGGSCNGLRYHPLDGSNFRLLTLDPGTIGESISGDIQELELINPPSYYALSYVWGQEPPIHRTIISGSEHFIQPNLFHALQRLRLQVGKYSIWVDRLCINQDDILERNMQVEQMASIYSNANGVMIWIGEADSTSKLALEYLSKITSDDFRWGELWWEEYGFAALAYVLERAWFRRGWVLQEAAFSKNSTILCGDQQIHMDLFITATRTIQNRLSTVSLSSNQILAKFNDSPAIKLIDIITGALRKHAAGGLPRRTMSLEALVYGSIYSVTSDRRDAIYVLLNLANDIASSSTSSQSDLIADYTKPVLDVFADFVLHCCVQSGQLDVICYPWAPVASTSDRALKRADRVDMKLQSHPTWIMTRDKLPFGDPSWQSKHRLHGNSLVNRSNSRCYFAHYGSRPRVRIGRTKDGICDGSLRATGLMLGEIDEQSTRMADGIITKECVDILRFRSCELALEPDDLPDAVWRTLCADRNEKGERAPHYYQTAMLHLLKNNSKAMASVSPLDLLDQMSSIDPEELLNTELPEHVEQFLRVVRDITWNRRTFRLKKRCDADRVLVGLVPQHARVGDQICVLYGCSVPVVLRQIHHHQSNLSDWQLIGDAYVHGVMDGEVLSSSLTKASQFPKLDFNII